MSFLKKRKEKKLNNFETKLKNKKFSSTEINSLIPIYKKVVSLSNIFISNIIMFIVSILLIVLATSLKNSNLYEYKEIIIWVFSIVSGVLVIVSFVLILLLLFQVLTCSIVEVRKKVLIWAILSIIPLISFITLFIMKWKVSHIYRYR